MLKKFKLFIAIAILLAQSQISFAQSTKAKIGFLLPLSGQYAAVGIDNQQGIEIAKSEIDPSLQFDLIFADSKADPTQSVSEFKKLSEIDKVIGAFVFRGPPGMAINPLSLKAHLPLLGGVGNKDFALNNPYAFQLWVRSDTEGEYLATQIIEKGFKKIALITVQDDWPVAVSNGFISRLKELNTKLIFDQELLPTDVDFRSQISKLRQSNPDAIFLNIGLNQIAPFAKQLREQGVKAQLFSNFWAGKKEVITGAGEFGEGMMFAEMATNLDDLKDKLKNRFNSSPSGATLSSYVATIFIAQSLKGLSNPNPDTFYSSLLAQKEVRTRNGVFEIKNRFVQFPMALRAIRNGIVVDTD
ncbi:MAG: penicillin-binding protein activator [Pseudobdellovibrionaceae bacterium]